MNKSFVAEVFWKAVIWQVRGDWSSSRLSYSSHCFTCAAERRLVLMGAIILLHKDGTKTPDCLWCCLLLPLCRFLSICAFTLSCKIWIHTVRVDCAVSRFIESALLIGDLWTRECVCVALSANWSLCRVWLKIIGHNNDGLLQRLGVYIHYSNQS